VGHLAFYIVVQVVFCAQYEHFGLYAQSLQLLHAGLGRFCLQLASGSQIGHIGEMDIQCPLGTQFPAQLADGLEEGLTFDVADGAAYFGNDEVEILLGGVHQYAALNLVGDVRHHLDGLSQVVASALALDDAQIDTPCGYAVVARSLNASESLVVSQVEICFHTIGRHVALTVLIGIQRTRVDIDVGVEFLDGNPVASCLQEFSQRG